MKVSDLIRWVLICLTLLVIFSSCATVQPWERGGLSDPIMIFDENSLDASIKGHHLERREGSVGGTGGQSGGCGCG